MVRLQATDCTYTYLSE